jgi:hypothetical protein
LAIGGGTSGFFAGGLLNCAMGSAKRAVNR